jgi:hypothetical protein
VQVTVPLFPTQALLVHSPYREGSSQGPLTQGDTGYRTPFPHPSSPTHSPFWGIITMVPHTGGTGYRTPFPHPIIPRTFPLQGDPTLAVLNLSPLGIHAYRGPSQSLQKPFSLITVSNPRMFSLRISRKGPLGKRDTVYSRPFFYNTLSRNPF